MNLHLFVEGQSEEVFVNQVIAPYLLNFNIFTDCRCVQTSFDIKTGRKYKGGLGSYIKFKREICVALNQFTSSKERFSTFIDLYGLPSSFPAYNIAKQATTGIQQVKILEEAISKDLNDNRVIPYIQLYEFETIILCEPQKLSLAYINNSSKIQKLIKSIAGMEPEEINNGAATAPSKRIKRFIPEYNKVFATSQVTPNIELSLIRKRCPHFNEWLTKLEAIGK
ncbi:MAG TPA: DUF4276 family protein [Candidatus Cloacimonas sp.]|nr:DUF4276 family protein [Candidatus Cloacimonas sp.]